MTKFLSGIRFAGSENIAAKPSRLVLHFSTGISNPEGNSPVEIGDLSSKQSKKVIDAFLSTSQSSFVIARFCGGVCLQKKQTSQQIYFTKAA
ncbi:hypothetical protein BGP76_15250 [Reichenbachiella sp. MSK19-1]|nr:hypothetical protein BGP76_15250 [Reichenbachiella sp. MSK19-1]